MEADLVYRFTFWHFFECISSVWFATIIFFVYILEHTALYETLTNKTLTDYKNSRTQTCVALLLVDSRLILAG